MSSLSNTNVNNNVFYDNFYASLEKGNINQTHIKDFENRLNTTILHTKLSLDETEWNELKTKFSHNKINAEVREQFHAVFAKNGPKEAAPLSDIPMPVEEKQPKVAPPPVQMQPKGLSEELRNELSYKKQDIVEQFVKLRSWVEGAKYYKESDDAVRDFQGSGRDHYPELGSKAKTLNNSTRDLIDDLTKKAPRLLDKFSVLDKDLKKCLQGNDETQAKSIIEKANVLGAEFEKYRALYRQIEEAVRK